MKTPPAATCLFVDIGGVLLTNGWDRRIRKRAATHFQLDLSELEERHGLTFDTYEEGKITLDEYLGRVVFYKPRPFTRAQFRRFIFAQSKRIMSRLAQGWLRSDCTPSKEPVMKNGDERIVLGLGGTTKENEA